MCFCFQVWYDNVPHPKLVEYKKDQNWVRKSGDYFVFPGGGTQFKEGVSSYIEFIEKVHHFVALRSHKPYGQKECTFVSSSCRISDAVN